MLIKNVLLVLLVLATFRSQGAPHETSIADSEVNALSIATNNESLTPQEKNLAKLWLLNESDWKKYKVLMKGPRRIWSPGLDPITALGVSETNESERRRYADIWMKVETRKVELELAFEVERMAAAERLHGNKKLVKNDAWIADWSKKHREVTTKISLFIDAECIKACSDYFMQLKASMGVRSVLDIYFAQGATSEKAGSWAREMNIDPNVVRSRQITLNFDKGTSDIMGVDMLKLPQVRVLDVHSGEVKETFVR